MGLSVGDGRRFYTNLYSYLKYDLSLVDNAHNFSLMVGYDQRVGGDLKRSMPIVKTLHLTCRYSMLEGQPTGVTVEVKKSGLFRSLFGRFNYDFKERYLFEANMRYDGTSRISDENRWGVFPSFSVAWRATEEEFIKNLNLNWLNNFKLRGSWGQLGNQNIGLYPLSSYDFGCG